MAKVLVTGASGTVGRFVVAELIAAGHRVRALLHQSKASIPSGVEIMEGDIASDKDVALAVKGVDAVIHCATSLSRHRHVDLRGTQRLISAIQSEGRVHLIYPSMVGAELIPRSYLSTKVAVEKLIEASRLPWSIFRFTDVNERVWSRMQQAARWPTMVVPARTRIQVLDAKVAALRLVDLVRIGPSGRVPDLGGPFAYKTKDLARSYLAASGRRRLVIPFNSFGLAGAALRAGANLTRNRAHGTRDWNDFVARFASR